jgi:hypothetical protein
MPTPAIPTERQQNIRNKLVILACRATIYLLVVVALRHFARVTLRESFATAIVVCLGPVIVGLWTRWLTGRQSRGALLLDCGPHPGKTMMWVDAVLIALCGMANFVRDPIGTVPMSRWGVPVLFGCTVIWALFVRATGRLEVREAGFWRYSCLLRWSAIDSYAWTDEGRPTVWERGGGLSLLTRTGVPVPSDATLVIRKKGFLSFLTRPVVVVPSEHTDEFDRLLKKHCRARASACPGGI